MYGPKILDLFDLLDPFSLEATAESWAQDGCQHDCFPRYPYVRGSSWCSRDVTDITLSQAAVIRSSLISMILVGVPLTSWKLCRSRWQSHPPQRRIPYSSGCLRHDMDIAFNRPTGPSTTALYPSF